MYDIDTETIKEGYPQDTKPILKTCPNKMILGAQREIRKYHCETEKCTTDEDCYNCYSGRCNFQSCEEQDGNTLFQCSCNKKNNFIYCGKANGMTCLTSL